jgi:hypothetical protein
MAAAHHATSHDREVPGVSDVAVVVGRAARVLICLAYEGGRRNHRWITGLTSISFVHVQRVLVAHRERKVAERRVAQFLGRIVIELASDPGAQFFREERGVSPNPESPSNRFRSDTRDAVASRK